jgi:hypothetical protein
MCTRRSRTGCGGGARPRAWPPPRPRVACRPGRCARRTVGVGLGADGLAELGADGLELLLEVVLALGVVHAGDLDDEVLEGLLEPLVEEGQLEGGDLLGEGEVGGGEHLVAEVLVVVVAGRHGEVLVRLQAGERGDLEVPLGDLLREGGAADGVADGGGAVGEPDGGGAALECGGPAEADALEALDEEAERAVGEPGAAGHAPEDAGAGEPRGEGVLLVAVELGREHEGEALLEVAVNGPHGRRAAGGEDAEGAGEHDEPAGGEQHGVGGHGDSRRARALRSLRWGGERPGRVGGGRRRGWAAARGVGDRRATFRRSGVRWFPVGESAP